jgi:hypothetical protein
VVGAAVNRTALHNEWAALTCYMQTAASLCAVAGNHAAFHAEGISQALSVSVY